MSVAASVLEPGRTRLIVTGHVFPTVVRAGDWRWNRLGVAFAVRVVDEPPVLRSRWRLSAGL